MSAWSAYTVAAAVLLLLAVLFYLKLDLVTCTSGHYDPLGLGGRVVPFTVCHLGGL